jgi:hypothetical protein
VSDCDWDWESDGASTVSRGASQGEFISDMADDDYMQESADDRKQGEEAESSVGHESLV